MTTALWFLAIQGIIGAFDTLYYHEWRARLAAGGSGTAPELKLHAARDLLYATLFGALPWLEWQGLWAVVLAAILLTEIILTLTDFVVERRVRKPLGDVYGGERVTHAVMGVIYGAMLANLLPTLWRWLLLPTALAPTETAASEPLRWSLAVMAIGVFLSGARDLYAAFGLPHGGWPWKAEKSEGRS
jgi:phosphatidylglycerophosphate synthase